MTWTEGKPLSVEREKDVHQTHPDLVRDLGSQSDVGPDRLVSGVNLVSSDPVQTPCTCCLLQLLCQGPKTQKNRF